MSHILATAGSNSSTSINFQLVKYTTRLLGNREVELLELAKTEFPIFGEDLEKARGIPPEISRLKEKIQQSSGLILSVNEHNGNPSAFFKNVLDWLSREDRRFFANRPVLLMSASTGKRGAASSRAVVEEMIPKFGGKVIATFSLPSYNENFNPGSGIVNPDLAGAHKKALQAFLSALN
ncbi:MAG: NAD(P)H-dependent oxidoreductase [Robiginitalea sp.]